jgi:hypothetical protein
MLFLANAVVMRIASYTSHRPFSMNLGVPQISILLAGYSTQFKDRQLRSRFRGSENNISTYRKVSRFQPEHGRIP